MTTEKSYVHVICNGIQVNHDTYNLIMPLAQRLGMSVPIKCWFSFLQKKSAMEQWHTDLGSPDKPLENQNVLKTTVYCVVNNGSNYLELKNGEKVVLQNNLAMTFSANEPYRIEGDEQATDATIIANFNYLQLTPTKTKKESWQTF